MNQSDLRSIETALGVSLPQHYVDLVTRYPAELENTEAVDFALLDDPSTVIEENLAVRGKPFFGGMWPDDLLVIGVNGMGDLYVTKLSGKSFSTGFFDHEVPAFYPHAESREEFVRKVLEEIGDAT